MKKGLKRFGLRFYFEGHESHPLNGCTMESAGAALKRDGNQVLIDGTFCRTEIGTFVDNEHNRTARPGYLGDTFKITAEDFGGAPVKVKYWACGQVEEVFYLVPENYEP